MSDQATGLVHAPSWWARSAGRRADELSRMGMAEKIMMGNLPAIRACKRKDRKVADAQPINPAVPGQHITGSTQLTDDVDARCVYLGPGEGILPPFDRQHHERVAVIPGGGQPEMMG